MTNTGYAVRSVQTTDLQISSLIISTLRSSLYIAAGRPEGLRVRRLALISAASASVTPPAFRVQPTIRKKKPKRFTSEFLKHLLPDCFPPSLQP